MALQYPSEWKFEGIGFSISAEAYNKLFTTILKIASGTANPQHVIETFKSAFGGSGTSSSHDWAVSDLSGVMTAELNNAAAFVDAYWSAITILKEQSIRVPSAKFINEILHNNGVPLLINPPHLVLGDNDVVLLKNETDTDPSDNPTLAKYKLGDKLGEGGFGTVYRAKKVTTIAEFDCAVKIFNPSAFTKDKEKALERFKREVRALSQLQHRSIVTYFDAGLDIEGMPYIVMSLIEGKDLRSATEGMEPRDILRLFIEVLEGLRFAHSRDILHRDLKPTNIMLRASDAQPVILDFGCAYLLNEESLTTTAIGSLGYIPPEIFADPKLRIPQHDVFSCGVILYELIARRRPDYSDYIPLAQIDPSYTQIDPLVRHAIDHIKIALLLLTICYGQL
jgi:serine/threonine protein kinase